MNLKTRTLSFLWALCVAAGTFGAAPARAWGDPESEPVIARLRNTYYYVVREKDYERDTKDDALLDMNDRVLAQVSSRFRKALDIEGSGHLMNGRVVNFAGVKNRRIRYRYTQNSWGDGVGNCALVPFHTIAVDPQVIPLGSLVRIDETVGMALPDGSIHDGLWRAEDVGGAIKSDRVDLFVGDDNQGSALTAHKIRHLQALTVRLVEEPSPDSCVRRTFESTGGPADLLPPEVPKEPKAQ